MRFRYPLLFAAAAVLVAGCASPPERQLSTVVSPYASLPNGHDPIDVTRYKAILVPSEESEIVGVIPYFEKVRGRPLNIVELSGGGQNGAFTAGLMNGWTASGERPQFDIVTGVSAGALAATHVFLGTPADDKVLEQIFTGVDRGDIYTDNSVLGVVGGDPSLFDTAPLHKLMERIITPAVLAQVAQAYDEGRRLLVGTTNLDYEQTWVWDMTLMAKEARPGYEDLYRRVLIASASPPVAFPPVEIDGHLFADGGTRSNLLAVGMAGEAKPTPPRFGPGNIFAVNNGRLPAKPKAIRDTLIDIAADGVKASLKASMETALMRAYFAAVSWGYRFHYVEIPHSTEIGHDMLAFDPVQMKAAYDAGQALGLRPGTWAASPALLSDIPDWLLEELRARSP